MICKWKYMTNKLKMYDCKWKYMTNKLKIYDCKWKYMIVNEDKISLSEKMLF